MAFFRKNCSTFCQKKENKPKQKPLNTFEATFFDTLGSFGPETCRLALPIMIIEQGKLPEFRQEAALKYIEFFEDFIRNIYRQDIANLIDKQPDYVLFPVLEWFKNCVRIYEKESRGDWS